MYQSASSSMAVPKYLTDGTKKIEDAANPKHSSNSSLVVIDARGSQPSFRSSLSTDMSAIDGFLLSSQYHLTRLGSNLSYPSLAPVVHSNSDCVAFCEVQQETTQVLRCQSVLPTKKQQQDRHSRQRSFGQAVRALGAKLEALVHRPFVSQR